MRDSPLGLVPDINFVHRLQSEASGELAKLADELGAVFAFEAIAPLLDSAEAQPVTWQALATAVQARAEHADAVLLLHGTDTLAYTSSALSLRLLGLGKAVVVSGAQKPFGEPDGDAWANLALALRTARNAHAHEVLVAFGGGVYRANRCTKQSAQANNAFHSPNWPVLAMTDLTGLLKWADPDTREVVFNPPRAATASPTSRSIQLGVLHLHPGIDIARWRSWLRAAPLDALVLRSYGSGNAPLTSTALLELLHETTASGALVVNISACLSGYVDATYATATPLTQAGVLSGRDMTLECALVKLDWVCQRHNDLALRRDEFNQIVCGESSVQRDFNGLTP